MSGGSFTNLALTAMTGAGAPDLVVLLGARIGLFTGGRSGSVIPHEAKVIQVDIESEEIGRNRDIDLAITSDCREALRAMLTEAATRDWPDRTSWRDAVGLVRSGPAMMFASALEAEAAPIHPYRLMAEIAKALPARTVVAADGGETASWMDMAARVTEVGTWMSHGYLGCLGTGMPFAIAAQVAHPDRRVLCVVGDGSVGLNFAEFDTMVRHGLPIVVVVNNDQLWGMSAHGQDLIFGRDRRVVTELGPVRYDLAAAGFGCHSEYVTEPGEIGPALERAFASGKAACVNVMTDPDVIAPVTMMLVGSAAAGGGGSGDRVVIPYYEDLADSG
jgi:acetolactate synthase-1/2/3 large subunit